MLNLLLIFQVIFGLSIIGLVLIQKTGTDGFGLGGGSGMGIMSGRAKASFFTRATAIMAMGFMLNSLLMAFLTSHQTSRSLIDQIPVKAEGSEGPLVPTEKTGGESAPLAQEPKREPSVPVEGKSGDAAPVPAQTPDPKPVVPIVPRAE